MIFFFANFFQASKAQLLGYLKAHFSNVLYIVTLYITSIKALTFENLCVVGAPSGA